MMRRGRICSIERSNYSTCTLTKGIKRYDQKNYDYSDRYRGSNGTYASNFETVSQINMKVCLYETDTEPQVFADIDIRDAILRQNPGWEKITASRLAKIQNKLVSTKQDFILIGNQLGYPDNLFTVE